MSNNVHHQRKVPSHLAMGWIFAVVNRAYMRGPGQLIYKGDPKILGFLDTGKNVRFNKYIMWRNLRRCPAKLKETAYITLVRSTLIVLTINCSSSLGPSSKDTAAISEVCQRGSQDDIQCDPDAALSRLARSEWSSARPQTGFIAQGRHWTCGRWSWPDWFSGCG